MTAAIIVRTRDDLNGEPEIFHSTLLLDGSTRQIMK